MKKTFVWRLSVLVHVDAETEEESKAELEAMILSVEDASENVLDVEMEIETDRTELVEVATPVENA